MGQPRTSRHRNNLFRRLQDKIERNKHFNLKKRKLVSPRIVSGKIHSSRDKSRFSFYPKLCSLILRAFYSTYGIEVYWIVMLPDNSKQRAMERYRDTETKRWSSLWNVMMCCLPLLHLDASLFLLCRINANFPPDKWYLAGWCRGKWSRGERCISAAQLRGAERRLREAKQHQRDGVIEGWRERWEDLWDETRGSRG